MKPWLYEGLTRTAWYEAGRHRPDDCVADPPDGFVASVPSDDHVAVDAAPVILDDSVADHPPVPSDEFVATPLARRVRLLPGGRDPAFLSILERLCADAPAARAAWGVCDPELAALLATDD